MADGARMVISKYGQSYFTLTGVIENGANLTPRLPIVEVHLKSMEV